MQVQQQTPSQEEEILQRCEISLLSDQNRVLEQIICIIKNSKKADAAVREIKKAKLWDYVISKTQSYLMLTNKDSERLFAYVNGEVTQCPAGKSRTFAGYSVGYRWCGPASVCDCARSHVSSNVSKTKMQYSSQKKDSIQKKRESTNLERYGTTNLFNNSELIKSAVKNKYGVDNVNKLSEIRDKIKKTNQTRYGGPAPISSDSVKKKINETVTKKYGVNHVLQDSKTIKKIKKTMIDRYGSSVPIHNDVIRKKIKDTNIARYGVVNAAQNDQVKDKIRQSTTSTFLKNLIERLEPHSITPIGEFCSVWDHQHWNCSLCLTNFMGSAQHGRVPKCPTCFPNYVSLPQKEIGDFIASLVNSINVVHNDRTLLLDNYDKRASKEIDILVKSHKLAIEYCGLRWHTELSGNKIKNYHYEKYQKCKDIGLQLITIWSDEWETNRSLVKSMIKSRLGMNTRMYARNLVVDVVSSSEAKKFFEQSHINGYVNSAKHYGLFDNGILYMCLAVSPSRYNQHYDIEITRMATKKGFNVVGGATRLFSAMIKDINPKSVISYCDLRWGTGKVYENMGFVALGKPTIGYQYVDINKPCERFDRRYFQKHKLPNTNGLSERDYLASNGFERIWDCGHQKYIWKNESYLIT